MPKEFQFTQKEKDLLFNEEIFPLKRLITKKLYVLFGTLIQSLKDSPIHQTFEFPINTDTVTGKITQGENYLSFPYVVLDFPRQFTKKSVFTFRSMFWFGHYFSFSLIVSGEFLPIYLPNLMRNKQLLHHQQIYFSFCDTPYNHAIELMALQLIENITSEEIELHCAHQLFFKLTSYTSEMDTQILLKRGKENYQSMLNALSSSANSLA